jgi:nucleotide-binding universal stress UspA family protein
VTDSTARTATTAKADTSETLTPVETRSPAGRSKGRIVVGVDGSEESKGALRWAARQAELTGASLQVITTWHFPASAFGAAVPVPADFDFEAGSASALADAINEVLGGNPTVEVVTAVEEGYPAPHLLAAAQGADLLVVGSRGHGAFAGMLLGSVSEHCVAHATCPVVVTHHAPRHD